MCPHQNKTRTVDKIRKKKKMVLCLLRREMKMRLVAIIGFVGIVLCCLNSFAEDTMKIGYVDTHKVFEAYDKAKGEFIKTEREKSSKEHARRQQELRKSDEELREKGSILTDEEKKKKREDIQKKFDELLEFERAQREKEKNYVAEALTEIYQVIEKIGEKEEFDLIIEKRSIFGKTIILFGKKSLDLTDKVTKELLKK